MYRYCPRKLLVVALFAFGIVAGCGSSPQTYLARGNKFFDAGKYDDAFLQYRNAIEKAPKLGEAHYRLALVELKRNHVVPAYRELLTAVQLMPDNQEAMAALARLALTLYNADPRHTKELYDQAASTISRLAAKNPNSYDTNVLKGALAIVDKKPADAVQDLEKALKIKPYDPDATLGLARALVMNDQKAEALAKVREIVDKDKSYGPAYQFLVEQYRAAGKLEDAENILKLKVANNPKQAAFILELAGFYAESAKPAEMQATLQKLLDNPHDFPDAHLFVGDFYATIRKPDNALTEYEEGLKSAAKDRANLYHIRMARILGAQRKWPESIQHLDDVLKTTPGDTEAKRMRALAWIEEGKRENLDPAIAELRSEIQNRPQDATLHFQIGTGLLRKGDIEGARKEWNLAAGSNSRYLAPRFALAQLELSQNNANAALQASEQILKVEPNDPSARLLHAACLTGAKQYSQARGELNRLAAEYPNSTQIQFRLGVLDIDEHRYKEAEDVFKNLQSAATSDPTVLANLAQAYRGENEPAKALEMLQAEVKKNPNSTVLHGLLAAFAIASRNYDLAIDQYKQLATLNPKSAGAQVYLASAYQAKGDLKTAMGIFEKASQLEPKSPLANFALAQAYLASGRLNEAKARYRYLLTLDPNNGVALNDLAYLMADSGENANEALALALRSQQHAPSDPQMKSSLADTLGWIYVKLNDNNRAIAALQPLVNEHPDNAEFRYHLAMAWFQKGNKPEARTQLQAALRDKPAPADESKIQELLARL